MQRQVSAALGKASNAPFDVVRRAFKDVREDQFADAVSRSLREGRILILIVGDGIREGLQSLAELVNRSATKAFSFGLVEAALYQLSGSRFLIQPRVLAATEIIARQVTILQTAAAQTYLEDDDALTNEDATDSAGGIAKRDNQRFRK